jgi:putative oxidoreductase
MVTAITVVHWSNGFFNGKGGIEFPLVLLAVAVAVAATGPGRFSIDRAIGWDDNISGAWWAIGVFVAAVILSFGTQAAFRKRRALRAAAA